MIEVERPPQEIAELLGVAKRAGKRRHKSKPTCADCFFHRRMLCALDLDEPCSTFRPDGPSGLVPPRQPPLLIRDT